MFAINHQGFTILAGSGMELEFFYLRFLENFHFFESKKFLSQGVCKIKIFISWRDARGVNGLSYAANRKILAGCGREVEIF